MKKVGLITLGLLLSITMFSQSKWGKTPQDSVTCIENLIYKPYMKSDKKLALDMWRVAYRTCPASQKSLYINGVKLYKDSIKAEKDPAVKKALKDTMYSIFDQRIEVFGEKCKVLGKKGQTMLLYSKDELEKTYETLKASIDLCGNKTEPGTAVAMMYAITGLEKKGLKTKEDVVEMFGVTSAICGANKAEKYTKAQQKIEALVTGRYLDCETIIDISERNFDANVDNLEWLKRTARLMKKKKCTDSEVFVKVAKRIAELEPSPEALINVAISLYNKEKYSEAIKYFKQAADSTDNDEDKVESYINIARASLKTKQYAQVNKYALKAAGLKKAGLPYLLIGDAYLSSASICDDGKLGEWAVYWAATDMYQKAKAVDPSVAAEANKRIARAAQYYPGTSDIFFYGMAKGDSYEVKCWINKTTTIRTKD